MRIYTSWKRMHIPVCASVRRSNVLSCYISASRANIEQPKRAIDCSNQLISLHQCTISKWCFILRTIKSIDQIWCSGCAYVPCERVIATAIWTFQLILNIEKWTVVKHTHTTIYEVNKLKTKTDYLTCIQFVQLSFCGWCCYYMNVFVFVFCVEAFIK